MTCKKLCVHSMMRCVFEDTCSKSKRCQNYRTTIQKLMNVMSHSENNLIHHNVCDKYSYADVGHLGTANTNRMKSQPT